MTEAAVAFAGVSKTFRGARGPSVDGLTLDIPRGGVFGLLGPNGSGKTTTLRMMFGLVRPDGGTIRALGCDVSRELPQVLPRMGALIEAPLFFPSFTGRRNLEVLATTRGIGAADIDEVLDIVDLRDRQHDAAKTYSLGMKQRLGIACALLGKPELLVFDEPSNGLDPAGMVDMRQLIRRIADAGDTTLIVSSHLLVEMEQVCDRVAILAAGRLIATGTPADLAASAGSVDSVTVEVEDTARAAEVLQRAGFDVHPGDESVLVVSGAEQRRVLTALLDADIDVIGVGRTQNSLESTFLALTKASS